MNYLQNNFLFLSQIIGIPVIDLNTGKKIGTTTDIVASLKEMYPRITALIFRKGMRERASYLPWRAVRKIVEDRAIYIGDPAACTSEICLAENEILLRDTFWDKQIVDISGSKVVRVNDLHLLKEDLNLWVVHMDIGFKGLIRRLGWSRPADFIVQWLFSYHMKDELIGWKFVQPITTDKGAGMLSMKTSGNRLSELHPADLADILVDLGIEERVSMLRSLDIEFAANTLKELPIKMRVQIAEQLNPDQLTSILNVMPMDEVVDILALFPRKKLNALYTLLPPDKVHSIRGLLELSERVAGSIMNVEYVSVRAGATAGQTIDRIRSESKNKESIYYVYVLDDNDMVAGVVTLRQLLIAPPERVVAEFMRRRIVKVKVDMDVKKVAEIFYKYDFTVVPVVDRANKILGIITIKDALESVFPEIREETEQPA